MPKGKNDSDKDADLERFQEDGAEQYLTTNQGLRVNDDQNSLKAGERGGGCGSVEISLSAAGSFTT